MSNTMIYKNIGYSDLSVSAIALGCMSLHGDETENIKLLHRAKDGGINFFDTADLYDKGANEALVGKAFKHHRKDVIIATKVGNQWRPDGSGWDWNPSKEHILKAVEESLRRLQTDYIDLYQLHGGTMEDNTDETIAAFEKLQQQGKIRYYGISSIRPNVIRHWVEKAKPASVMLQYSLLDRRPEENVLPLLQEKGIGVLVRGALAQGLLLGKPPKEYLNQSKEAVEKATTAIQSLKPFYTTTAAAIQFVLRHKAVTSAVVGIRTATQLSEAIDAAAAPALSDADYNLLALSSAALNYTQHR